jgi:hypothetical protein
MHAITTVCLLVAAPLRRIAGALLIAVVIAGVVSMHSMSGSPGAHLPLPVIAAAHEVERADLTDVVAGHTGQAGSEQTAGHGARDGSDAGQCPSGCGSHDAHDMTTAMCLMVLVILLTLAVPPASFWAAAILPLAQRILVVAPRSRPAVPPSLHALGISRT